MYDVCDAGSACGGEIKIVTPGKWLLGQRERRESEREWKVTEGLSPVSTMCADRKFWRTVDWIGWSEWSTLFSLWEIFFSRYLLKWPLIREIFWGYLSHHSSPASLQHLLLLDNSVAFLFACSVSSRGGVECSLCSLSSWVSVSSCWVNQEFALGSGYFFFFKLGLIFQFIWGYRGSRYRGTVHTTD
jgi:hypothetical protein